MAHDPQQICSRLREIVTTSLTQNNLESAKYFGNKLVAFSNGDQDDVLLLARCYFASREYHRTVHLIEKFKVLEEPISTQKLQFHLLVGQCYAATRQWEECLDILETIMGESEEDFDSRLRSWGRDCSTKINIVASLCLLRGRAYEATENRPRSSCWYKIALRCDYRCYEAFLCLIENQLLTGDEECELLRGLDIPLEDEYISMLYASRLNKCETSKSIGVKSLEGLEAGYNLKENTDIITAKAELSFYQYDTEDAYILAKRVYNDDPFNSPSILIYVSTMVDLNKTSELFYCAHSLVDTNPEKAISWYAVGCYYLVVKKFNAAQRYFHKSTSLDPNFAPAWVGFGNAFASQEESDQAMASYRTAARLYPGSHLPGLCIGMEYLRTNNLSLARQYVEQATTRCPSDPLARNELGVIFYKMGCIYEAKEELEKALHICQKLPRRLWVVWEPCIFNLGHVYRKLRRYEDAVHCYQTSMSFFPKKASTYSALGLTYHIQGKLDKAIKAYHIALGHKPDDTVTSDLLTQALQEQLDSQSKTDLMPSTIHSSILNISFGKDSDMTL